MLYIIYKKHIIILINYVMKKSVLYTAESFKPYFTCNTTQTLPAITDTLHG